MSSNQNAAHDFLGSIIEKASNEASFRSELVSNPQKAIEDYKGGSLNIPAGKKIVVCDQTNDDTIYINIPSASSHENMELSDEQLEMVSGGWGWTIPVGITIYKWWRNR